MRLFMDECYNFFINRQIYNISSVFKEANCHSDSCIADEYIHFDKDNDLLIRNVFILYMA